MSCHNGHLSQLAAAVFFAGSYLFAKRLSQFVPAGVVVAMMSVWVTVALLPIAIWVWVPVTPVQLAWLAVVAGFATGGITACHAPLRRHPWR